MEEVLAMLKGTGDGGGGDIMHFGVVLIWELGGSDILKWGGREKFPPS